MHTPFARPTRLLVASIVAALALVGVAALEAKKIKINTEHDKTFDFSRVRTWSWHPSGKGEVKLALTATSDPERLKAIADPVIVAAVEREMRARGLTQVAEHGDVLLTYWLLGTIGDSSQYIGQFIPSSTEWGIAPFQGSTQAMRAFPVGTLLLDAFAANGKDHVWRGAAQAEVDLERSQAERRQRLDGAIRDLLKKFPPRK